MSVAARESGTVSRTLFPLDEYVAATRSSTLSWKAFVLAQFVRSLAKEKPESCFVIFGRSVKNIFSGSKKDATPRESSRESER